MKPKELYQTKDKYKVFDLSVFRKHIYHERDSAAKREYQFEKKK